MSVTTFSPSGAGVSQSVVEQPVGRTYLPAGLYFLLSMADLCDSMVAFRFGVAEGNPFMAWLANHGLFVPGKLFLSLFVAVLMFVVYNTASRWRWVVWSGIGLMILVVAYHVWALPQVIGLPVLRSIL